MAAPLAELTGLRAVVPKLLNFLKEYHMQSSAPESGQRVQQLLRSSAVDQSACPFCQCPVVGQVVLVFKGLAKGWFAPEAASRQDREKARKKTDRKGQRRRDQEQYERKNERKTQRKTCGKKELKKASNKYKKKDK